MDFTPGNHAELVVDGPACRHALLDLLAGAEHRLSLASFIFRPDEAGHAVADALSERARRGVAVRVLFDPAQSASGLFAPADSSRGPGRRAVSELRRRLCSAGVEVRSMRPGGRRPAPLGGSVDHRKLVVADGARALVPSFGIADSYLYPSGPAAGRQRWHDAATAVEGPAVAELDAVFARAWARAGGGPVVPLGVAAEAGDHRVAVIDSPALGEPSRLRAFYREGLLERAADQVLLATPYAADRVVFDGWAEVVTQRPDLRITLVRPHPDLTDYIPPRLPGSSRVASWVLRRHDEVLRAARVEVREAVSAFPHLKLGVADDRLAVHGSYNLTYRSALLDPEVAVLVEGPDHPRQVRALLEADALGARPAPATAPPLPVGLRRLGRWLADRAQPRLG